jgi:hypothetical protein
MRSVRTIREVGMRSYAVDPEATEINDGEEFQARDGSNLRTMAEAEAEERREEEVERVVHLKLQRDLAETAVDADLDGRSIPELVWSLVISPFRLAVALFKIPLGLRVELAKGQAS